MDKMAGGDQKRYATVFVLMLVGTLTAGCGTGFPFGTGGGRTPAATATAEETTAMDAPKSGDAPTNEPVVVASPSPQTPESGESPSSEPQEFVGEIELSVEGRPGVEEFYFAATECMITPTQVQAIGQGVDLSTGEPSKVVIQSTPLERLGESVRSEVYQAAGSITVTVADEEYVSDGRMHTVQGHSIPSMFTYRLEDPGIKYVVSWWSGGSQVSAGYVKVACNG